VSVLGGCATAHSSASMPVSPAIVTRSAGMPAISVEMHTAASNTAADQSSPHVWCSVSPHSASGIKRNQLRWPSTQVPRLPPLRGSEELSVAIGFACFCGLSSPAPSPPPSIHSIQEVEELSGRSRRQHAARGATAGSGARKGCSLPRNPAHPPSCIRLAAACCVGEKWSVAMAETIRRSISPGKGSNKAYVRRPASTWATGILRKYAAIVVAIVVVESPERSGKAATAHAP